MEFIPHQLHLTIPQVKKLLERVPFNIPFKNMGSGMGDEVIHLLPQNARKLLSAFRKNKGMRLQLNPHELIETIKKGKGVNIEKILNSPVGKKITEKLVDKAIDKLVGGKVNPLDTMNKVLASPVVQKIGDKVLDKAIDKAFSGGKLVKGSEEMKERMAKLRAMRKTGKGHYENLVKVQKGLRLLGTPFERAIGVNPADIGEPIGEALGAELYKGIYGHPRGYGLKSKKNGGGATTSAVYKKTLKNNFSGLTLNNVGNNVKSNAPRNPKVKPSSDEMTMSPYQKLSSPAMNPFVPKYYTQEGGTSCGYGGRGLYAGGLF